jgi:hypothetical protein
VLKYLGDEGITTVARGVLMKDEMPTQTISPPHFTR